jgi:hypothetical protein
VFSSGESRGQVRRLVLVPHVLIFSSSWRLYPDGICVCGGSVAGDGGVPGGAVERRVSLLSTPNWRCAYISFRFFGVKSWNRNELIVFYERAVFSSRYSEVTKLGEFKQAAALLFYQISLLLYGSEALDISTPITIV